MTLTKNQIDLRPTLLSNLVWASILGGIIFTASDRSQAKQYEKKNKVIQNILITQVDRKKTPTIENKNNSSLERKLEHYKQYKIFLDCQISTSNCPLVIDGNRNRSLLKYFKGKISLLY